MMSPEDMLFAYNNNGFNLLGVLVAAMTGGEDVFNGFAEYMAENILKPAGMSRSTFILDYTLEPYLAGSYIDAAHPDAFVFFNGLPTGGLFSTAYDMARFMHIFLGGGGELLSAEYLEQMKQVHDFDFSYSMQGLRYGLGLMHTTGMDGFQYFGHGGNLVHYHSDMVFDADSGIGVFVTTNSATGIFGVSALASSILMTAVTEKTEGLTLLPPRADAAATPIEFAPEELAALEGVYVGPMEYYLMAVDNGILYMFVPFVPEFPPLPLTPLSDGSFYSMFLGRLWFERVEEDGEETIILRMGDLGYHMMAVHGDMELFAANESFAPWIGLFVPVNEGNSVSLIASVLYNVDAFGFAYSQMANLNLVAPTTALQVANDNWLFGIENIETDQYGRVVSYEMLGKKFVRIE
jgi:hypothetical protein